MKRFYLWFVRRKLEQSFRTHDPDEWVSLRLKCLDLCMEHFFVPYANIEGMIEGVKASDLPGEHKAYMVVELRKRLRRHPFHKLIAAGA